MLSTVIMDFSDRGHWQPHMLRE